MSAHTPGPWGLAHYAKGAALPIPFIEHKTIAVFSDGARQGDVAYMQHGLWGDDQALANARLIASAPDLLEALQTCMAALHWNEEAGCLTGITGDQWHAALDIIDKATGEAA